MDCKLYGQPFTMLQLTLSVGATPTLRLARIAALPRRRPKWRRLASVFDAALARVRRDARPPLVLLAAGQSRDGSRLLLVPACDAPHHKVTAMPGAPNAVAYWSEARRAGASMAPMGSTEDEFGWHPCGLQAAKALRKQ